MILNTIERTANPAKTRTRNCHRKFIKSLLPEKRKEKLQTKQPQFKSQLNKSQ